MDPNTVERLKVTLKSLKGTYKVTKTLIESQVKRRQWATDRYFSLIPFEQERFKMLRGKLLGKEPRVPKNCCVFGFDGQDRLCLIRVLGADGKPQTEQFVSYDSDQALIKTYMSAGKAIGKVVEVLLSGGIPQSSNALGAEGDRISEKYEHSDGRLTAIDVEQFRPLVKKTFSHRYELNYPTSGKVEGTRVASDGKRELVFSMATPVSVFGTGTALLHRDPTKH